MTETKMNLFLGMDVRVSRPRVLNIHQDQAVGERGQSVVRVEQTQTVQFPRFASQAALTESY